MRKVIVESPFAGDVEGNLAYVAECMRDCLKRGDAPFASHALYTQFGVLDDSDPEERRLGMLAGWEWYRAADASVVYLDRCISAGMMAGIEQAQAAGVPIEYRRLESQQLLLWIED